MLYQDNLPHAPSEIEEGYYYATIRWEEPTKERIILIRAGRVLDSLQLFGQLGDYDLTGPVPTKHELESLTGCCNEDMSR